MDEGLGRKALFLACNPWAYVSASDEKKER
jgi:hypothetical protein